MTKKVCILSSVHIALDNRVFYREARSLVDLGYQVTLIAIHEREETISGVNVIGLPKVPRWRRPLTWWTLLRLALREDADIYHFHDPELLFVTPFIRLIKNKPVIYDIHEVYADFIRVKDYMPTWVRYPIAWVFSWLEPLLARLQSGLIFADDEIARSFSQIDKPKVTLFNFPGRFFVEQGKRETADLEHRPPTIIHLGGHERNRGTALMVEAFAIVHAKVPDARLVMVGHFVPENLEAEVRSAVEHAGLANHVEITGRVDFEEIGDYLGQACIGWVPWQPYPKNEKNIPTKLFEYMSYGLAIVSSDLRSTRPFVTDGVNGWLVEADRAYAHAEKMVELLRNPALCERLGKSGQSLVQEKYNWDAMEVRLGDFYRKLLDTGQPG